MNNITGTIINYYIHCKRQCYLHYHRINLEDESGLVKIGKALHERHNTEEIEIDNIKLDKIKGEFVTEIKKSDADFNASRFQLLFYLKKLKEKGVIKKGRLTFLEKNKVDKKNHEILLDDSSEKELEDIISEIKILVSNSTPPAIEKNNKCKKCAYYAFCYI
ncbi:CRISPR-associated protein Cas4 [Cetobacterium somerae]|uniref:CRISPR-associated protein Cas4 n=1 Tax=Cetobacterium sp. NK01 TaxID=2993530 RepID=UPI002116D8A5|nr:CRISPR-associated protein Cas4 [Cetobacterium sp. NK01]MCQ8213454.1 CRISPR-associated protein Cas4 [Cetobacterium sp. NK01]